MHAVADPRPSRVDVAAALLVHLVGGLWWLSLVPWFAGAVGGTGAAVLWTASALVLWVVAAVRLARADGDRGPVWRLTFGWWLSTFAAPLVLAALVIRTVRPRPSQTDEGASMPTSFDERLDLVERELDRLRRQVHELRAEASQRPAAAAPAPTPASPPTVHPAPVVHPAPSRAPAPAPARPAGPPVPPRPPREVDLADLLGPRALAWAGGVVTLLGVVFFFVLAVDRGWIGPVERVGLGALASALVFGAGVFMRARYGRLYSAFAAVGAGLAGGFATLLAAAALYELVPDLAALGIAAAIAAVGVWTALRWSSETIAGIGLLGAMLVPLSVVFSGGISVIGTAFALVLLAATALVALRRGWDGLLALGGAVALGQAFWLVLQEGEGAGAAVVTLAAAFWLVTLAIGLVRQLRLPSRWLDRLAVSFLLAATAFAGAAAVRLLNGELLGTSRQGLALAAVAAVTGLVAAVLFRVDRARDLSALLGGSALAVAAVAAADLLGGQSLAIAWAAQAALLAWLAARIGETRYHALSLVYLALAAGHALLYDSPLTRLLEESAHPAAGAGTVAAVGLAALVFALHARGWTPVAAAGGPVALAVGRAFGAFVDARPHLRVGAFAAAGLGAMYASALLLLEAFTAWGGAGGWDWGQVAVTAMWSAASATLFVGSLAAGLRPLQYAGLVGLGLTLVKLAGLDAGLPETERALALLAVAAAALVCGVRLERAARGPLSPVGVVLLVLSAALAAAGSVTLLDEDGLALALVAALYAGLAAWAFRATRELATVLGTLALPAGVAASALLLEGTALVAAWAAAAVVLAWLGAWAGEPRLQPVALLLAALALGLTLAALAPPSDLLVAGDSPAAGVPALLLALAALLGVRHVGRARRAQPDRFDLALEARQEFGREWLLRAAGALGLYAGSLALLGLALLSGGASLETEFQRGHTAVSAFWGVVGLTALYLGLRRAGRKLRVAGFVLFGISLAKLFLYDLSRLDSVTRALSFLAVGAVLLLGGFFYQRLTSPDGDGSRRAKPGSAGA